MKSVYRKYKHALPALCYLLIYSLWFSYLEQKVKRPANLIHMKIDDAIPFCEFFIVPYLLWFFYVAAAFIYFFFANKKDYQRLCVFLFTGMTVFLIISTLWPNGHHLRPHIMPRENIFTMLTQLVYRSDTPTNLWPSIHVYNSLGVYIAVVKNQKLVRNKWISVSALLLSSSIILSTVFLKQHSVFDVITAFIMAAVMYLIVYSFDIVSVYQVNKYLKTRHQRMHHV